ncbi:MAG TPA: FGGY family carbohydrate kinase [Gammaproteobacteria bacterium]|nr:FGGY family carbohydrate kinase [Gammaproteobacteria bacterium]
MTPRPFFLVLDQGSHAGKAMVFDGNGRIMAAAERCIGTRRPQPGWVEHDAEEVVSSLRDAVADAVASSGVAGITSAGLAIQRSSVVCWDRNTGEALSPVLSWQDRRNAGWLESQHFDPDRLREITGLVASPHYGASKLRWCLDHLAGVQRALVERRLCCGPLASFVLQRLLLERPCLVDPANASRTLLWDLRSRDWSEVLLAACGVPAGCLPRCVPSRYHFGQLDAAGVRVPLTVATGDQSAALFAHGEPSPGQLFVNIGTGAFVQRVFAGTPGNAPGLLRSLAWQDPSSTVGVLEGTVNGAGAAMQWLAEERGTAVETLVAGADRWLAEITAPPLFLNGVGGLGAPYWVADCPIEFSSPGSLEEATAAVLESVVFLLAVNIEALQAASTGATLGRAEAIVVSGGMARFDGLCQRLADLSGLVVRRSAAIEATAQGLAWLLGRVPAPTDGREVFFQPRANQPLAQRYARWRGWLESRLAELVGPATRG